MSRLAWMAVAGTLMRIWAQPSPLCAPATTIVVPGARYRTSADNQQRVDLRRCQPGVTDHPQIVAWSDRGKSPALVNDTTGEEVLQVAVAKNVFVVAVAGGTRDRIYVIVYQSGRPLLRVQRAVRELPTLRLSPTKIELEFTEGSPLKFP